MLSVENVINVIQQLILDTFIYIIRASYVFMFKWIKPKNCASFVIRRSALQVDYTYSEEFSDNTHQLLPRLRLSNHIKWHTHVKS